MLGEGSRDMNGMVTESLEDRLKPEMSKVPPGKTSVKNWECCYLELNEACFRGCFGHKMGSKSSKVVDRPA